MYPRRCHSINSQKISRWGARIWAKFSRRSNIKHYYLNNTLICKRVPYALFPAFFFENPGGSSSKKSKFCSTWKSLTTRVLFSKLSLEYWSECDDNVYCNQLFLNVWTRILSQLHYWFYVLSWAEQSKFAKFWGVLLLETLEKSDNPFAGECTCTVP